MNKTILLTGATGFLGSNLLKRLVAETENYNVIVLKRSFSNTFRINSIIDKIKYYDLDKLTNVDLVFKENKIDTIIHCATIYGRREIEPLSLIEANLILPLQLLEIGCKNGVKTFINTDTILDKRVNLYSLSKSQFRDWLTVYKEKMVCLDVALEHFYGPMDDKSKFVTFIIESLLENVDKLELTKGEQERDFIYIDDVVDAFIKILNKSKDLDKGYYDYEIGTGKNIKIKDFIELVKQIVGNDKTILNFGVLPYRKFEIMKHDVNIREIKKLGWSPKISLEDGLRKIVKFEKECLGK
ncbi:NAD-dependent epimerase/dehydratase family protein [bacterium]